MHRVMIKNADYENCREAVDQAFDLFPVNAKGKKVLIKPNALRAANPEQGISTHPSVVSAIIERVEEMGPELITVGDNPGMFSYGANEKTFEECGLMEASKGYYRNIGSDAGDIDFIPDFFDRVSVSKAVLDADIFISVPKFKTHGLTIITGAIKNSYGIIPGALKAEIHVKSGNPLRFNELMVDVFSLRVPDLFIVDAVVGMEGNGPASTELRDIGRIMASDNAVAMDAIIARMMGLEPEDVPFLEFAMKRGLGDYRQDAIEILGDMIVLPDFKLPPEVRFTAERPASMVEFFNSRARMRPEADSELCTACETCVEQCPVSALQMEGGIPVVDSGKCIACFCCQEICPEMAIRLS